MLAAIDLPTQLLPDAITLPLLWAGLSASVLGATVPPTAALFGAVAGYLSLWSVYWMFRLASGHEGIGYGDFKLLAALGVVRLGWHRVLPIIPIAIALLCGAQAALSIRLAGALVVLWRSRWCGLVELGPVFLTNDGRPFALTTRRTTAGNASRSCEVLTQVIRKLHDQAGSEAVGATAARRTFGVRLKREGYDLRYFREMLGLANLSAAKAPCGGEPVDLGRIVAKVL